MTGLGEKIIEQLKDKGLIENIADIYYLKKEDIKSLKKDGEKFAQNLIDAIEKSKESELDKLICALGIPNVGAKTAKTLSKKFKSIDELMKAEVSQLILVDDLGEIMAQSIYTFFKQSQTIDLINRLKQAGVNTESKANNILDDRFQGKTFVLTGTLENYTRDEASNIIEAFGGKTSSSVSKKTSYVLAGEEAGSKLTKAEELGITIITEEQFKEMIK